MGIQLFLGQEANLQGYNPHDWISARCHLSSLDPMVQEICNSETFFPLKELDLDLLLTLLSKDHLVLYAQDLSLVHPFVLDRVDVTFAKLMFSRKS